MSSQESDDHSDCQEEGEKASVDAENDSNTTDQFDSCKEVSESDWSWEAEAAEHALNHFEVAEFHPACADEDYTEDKASDQQAELLHPVGVKEAFFHLIEGLENKMLFLL